jgi:Xaa-Pro aminopeptidase
MHAQGVEACLLFNEPNIRYATDASAMPIWSNTTFVRCALVPAEGRPILFEHPNSMHLFRGIEAEVRPMHAWEFYDDTASHAAIFARQTVAALRELGVSGGRLAVDRLGTPGFLALEREGIAIVDSAPVTTAAREIKTPEEIGLFELNGAILMEMLANFERAIAPGDLVYVDTDAVGIKGCFFCVSRTFLCGDRPPAPAQREAYRTAHDWLLALLEMIRPGITCRELAAKAPRLPQKFMPQRYEVMIHSVGLEEESPSVAYPDDPQPNGDRVLQENMILVAEVYCGEVGGRDGVKLGNEVLVTSEGAMDLVPYPYCDALLG